VDSLQERMARTTSAPPVESHLVVDGGLPVKPKVEDAHQHDFLAGLWIGDHGGVMPPGTAARPPGPPIDYTFPPRPELAYGPFADRRLVPDPATQQEDPGLYHRMETTAPMAASPLATSPVAGYGLVGPDSFAAGAPQALSMGPPPVSHLVSGGMPVAAFSMQYYGDVYHPQPVPHHHDNGFFHAVHRGFGG